MSLERADSAVVSGCGTSNLQLGSHSLADFMVQEVILVEMFIMSNLWQATEKTTE